MKKDSDKKADEKKEVRQTISCDKCGSHYVYVLKDGQVICRRCGNRNGSK
jgi:formylmethanofuran dehydrogenase subunit E